MLKVMALILSTVFILPACTTTDPRTGETKVSDASKGAGLGAAAGAVIGAMTSNKSGRAKGVISGAAVGAALGGGIGYARDAREKKLREQMADTGVKVEESGQGVKVIIPGNISFPNGSAEVVPEFYPVLDRLVVSLREYPDSLIQITGHTDNVGSFPTNQQLSRGRARAVAMYIGQHGIALDRLEIDGKGSARPIADNATAEGRAQNRRVEINIVPTGKNAMN